MLDANAHSEACQERNALCIRHKKNYCHSPVRGRALGPFNPWFVLWLLTNWGCAEQLALRLIAPHSNSFLFHSTLSRSLFLFLYIKILLQLWHHSDVYESSTQIHFYERTCVEMSHGGAEQYVASAKKRKETRTV